MPGDVLRAPRLDLLPLTRGLAGWALAPGAGAGPRGLARAEDWPDVHEAPVLALATEGWAGEQWLVALHAGAGEPVPGAGQSLVIGTCGVRAVHADGALEIGYALVRSARGRGLASEAVGVLVEHLLARPDVVAVVATATTTPSLRLLDRLGFAPAGDGVTHRRTSAPEHRSVTSEYD